MNRLGWAAPLWLALSCAHPGGDVATEPNASVDAARPGAPPGEYCPTREPAPDSPCPTGGEKCMYLSGDRCGRIWQCYLGHWKQAVDVPCSAEAAKRCPSSADESLAGKIGDDLKCLYRPDVLCGFEYPRSEPECSGVERRPDELAVPVPPSWRCRVVAFDPCESSWNEGEACAPNGYTCGTTCCGRGGTCIDGHWQTREYPCPP